MESVLYNFLDEWLFNFNADPFFVPFKIEITKFKRRSNTADVLVKSILKYLSLIEVDWDCRFDFEVFTRIPCWSLHIRLVSIFVSFKWLKEFSNMLCVFLSLTHLQIKIVFRILTGFIFKNRIGYSNQKRKNH